MLGVSVYCRMFTRLVSGKRGGALKFVCTRQTITATGENLTLAARRTELEATRAVSRRHEGELRSAERSGLVSAELLESDWRDRSEHADAMKNELREAQQRLEGDQRCVHVASAQNAYNATLCVMESLSVRVLQPRHDHRYSARKYR